MGNDNNIPGASTILKIVNSIKVSDTNNELRQALQHLCSSVLFHSITPTISRKIHSNNNVTSAYLRGGKDMTPHYPTVWKTVQEDHKMFVGGARPGAICG